MFIKNLFMNTTEGKFREFAGSLFIGVSLGGNPR
jgi:hypothetical protein